MSGRTEAILYPPDLADFPLYYALIALVSMTHEVADLGGLLTFTYTCGPTSSGAWAGSWPISDALCGGAILSALSLDPAVHSRPAAVSRWSLA